MAERNDAKAGMLTQFNAGEFSNALAGRVDYPRLKASMRKAINVIPEVAGGIKKFYGTRYINSMPIAKQFVMIPFHSEDSLFTLVLHDGTCDAIINDKFIGLGLRLPVIEDYRTIRYEQANDVLFCCCPSCNPFQIEYRGDEIFFINKTEFEEVPYFPFGYKSEYNGTLKTTGITGVITVEKTTELPETSLVMLMPESFNFVGENKISSYIYSGAYSSDYGITKERPTLGDVTFVVTRVREGVETEVASISGCGKNIYDQQTETHDGVKEYYAYVSLTLESILHGIKSEFPNSYLDYVTSQDHKEIVIPLTDVDDHEDGDEYTLSVSIDDSDVSSELIISQSSDNTDLLPYLDDRYFRSDSSDNKVYIYTTSGERIDIQDDLYSHDDGKDLEGFGLMGVDEKSTYENTTDLIGRKIKFYQNSDSDAVKVWYQGLSASTNDIVLSDGHYYRATGGGTTGNIKPTHTEGVVSDGKVNWQYLHSGNVSGTIVSVEDANHMKVDLGKETLPIATYPGTPSTAVNNFTNYRWSMWGAFGRWPDQVFFSNGRMGYICNSVSGTYYALSCSDDYFNFAEDTYGEQLDTNAVVGLISGGHVSNKINWVIAREKVYLGSYGAEFVIYGNNDVITPSSVICKPVSFTGGDKIAALKYMTTSIFVGAGGNELYSVDYDYATDTYLPTNISYVSEHLLQDKIEKIVGAPRPDKTIYILTKNGKLVQFVNYVTEKVSAFSEINLGSDINDISISYSGNNTGVYIARVVGEEIWFERFSIDNPTYMLSSESFDSVGSIVSVPRLADREVYVKYDTADAIGQFKKVSLDVNGEFDMREEMTRYMVGIPMPMEMRTQPLSGSKLEGAQQAPVKMMARIMNTGEFSYGTSNDFTKYVDFKPWSKMQEYGSEHRLSTGDIELNLPAGYMHKTNAADNEYPNSTGVGLNFISDTPEPFNLLLISEVYK